MISVEIGLVPSSVMSIFIKSRDAGYREAVNVCVNISIPPIDLEAAKSVSEAQGNDAY